MTQTAQTTEWLTVAEVAAKLNLSKMTVYRMIDEKKLPAYKFGRTFRIKTDEFKKFVEDSQVS